MRDVFGFTKEALGAITTHSATPGEARPGDQPVTTSLRAPGFMRRASGGALGGVIGAGLGRGIGAVGGALLGGDTGARLGARAGTALGAGAGAAYGAATAPKRVLFTPKQASFGFSPELCAKLAAQH